MAQHRVSTPGSAAISASASRRSADAVLAELGRTRMSARKLADLLGWSHTQLSRRLRTTNATAFSVDELDDIARVLGVPLTRLIVDGPVEVPRARTG